MTTFQQFSEGDPKDLKTNIIWSIICLFLVWMSIIGISDNSKAPPEYGYNHYYDPTTGRTVFDTPVFDRTQYNLFGSYLMGFLGSIMLICSLYNIVMIIRTKKKKEKKKAIVI